MVVGCNLPVRASNTGPTVLAHQALISSYGIVSMFPFSKVATLNRDWTYVTPQPTYTRASKVPGKPARAKGASPPAGSVLQVV